MTMTRRRRRRRTRRTRTTTTTPRNALSVGSLVGHVFYPHLTRTHTNLMCERRLEDDNDNNDDKEE